MAQSSTAVASNTAAPRRARFERRKEEILNAAAALFNRHGLRDATLAVVASEIGLNLKSLRYYFEKREDLVAAAFMHSIDLHRELVEAALPIADFEQRIRHFVRGYFELRARVYRGEQPEFMHFGDLRSLTEPHSAVVGAAYTDLFRLTRRLFPPPDGSWTAEERAADTHMLISQLLWSVIWIDGYVPEDFPRVADRLVDLLLHGIAAKQVDFDTPPAAMPTPFVESERLSQDSFLRAATHLINHQGYRGASVDRISALLNVTKGAFYHHNETRDALVVECFERSFAIIREAQDQAMASDLDGMTRVASAAVSLVSRQMLPEGEMLRTSALTAVGPDLRKEMERRMSLLTLRFADMLNDGLIDGSVRVCDMRIAAEMVTATINAAEELKHWVPSATLDNAASLFVRPLLNGMMHPGS